MAFSNRYSGIDKALLVATGNSLVLCGSTTQTEVNTSGMVTVAGTPTRDWTLAGSTATLAILQNSTILYAELIWYSTVMSSVAAAQDVQSVQDQAITFITPTGTQSVSPQNTQSFTAASGSIQRFRSADVTAIIGTALSGTYTVAKVPTSIPSTGLSDTVAGWTLVVIYRNDALKPQRITFSSGINYTDSQTPIQTSVTGVNTPSRQSDLAGRVFVACANGQPLIAGESFKSGNSFANLSSLGNGVGVGNSNPGTAPNNPYDNIFAGQINVCDPLSNSVGLLNITGSNGNVNHNAFVPTQVMAARNKWDMADFDLLGALTSAQTQVALQYTQNLPSAGLEWVGMGAQVRAVAPDMTFVLTGSDADGDSEHSIEVGEIFAYSLQIRNTGDAPADNVILKSPLDPSSTFIPNSLRINGTIQQGADIGIGINLGSIPASGVINVLFEVSIVNEPVGGILSNSVNYSYQFVSGPGSPIYTNTGETSPVDIWVRSGMLGVVKTASAFNAAVNDTVTYTITVTNIGSELATNLLFQDQVSAYCSFIPRSVVVDGVTQPSYDPNTGFALSDLVAGISTVISFDVTINGLSPTTLIDNRAYVTFSYVLDQNAFLTTKTVSSNTTEIQIQYSDMIGNRWGSDNNPNVGDVVMYTLTLMNIGNIPAANVAVREPAIPGTSFIAGSVTINSVPQTLLDPFVGFVLNTPIAPQATTTITYEVEVNELPPGGLIVNIATVPFRYQIEAGAPIVQAEVDSNEVVTRLNFVVMNIEETVDKAYALVGDILYYSVNLTNTGNIDAAHTIFQSAIETGTAFIPGSVAINGVTQLSYNTETGFSVGTIAPGVTTNVTFQARVVSVPTPNIVYNQSHLTYDYQPDPNGNHITNTVLSNRVQTIINAVQYTVIKEVDQVHARVGNTLIYTTTITNTGTVPLMNVNFADDLANMVQFMPGTVSIDGVNYPAYDPTVGFPIFDVNPTEVYTISFKVEIISVPAIGFISNASQITSTYQVTPTSPIITDTTSSTIVETEVVIGDLAVIKTVDKSYATLGEGLLYAFTVTNTGTATVNDVNFIDIMPTGATFNTGTVMINGINKSDYDPNVGFLLGNLTVGQVVIIQFMATVTSLPVPNQILNNAVVAFDYDWNPQAQPISSSVTSNTVTTTINQATSTLIKQVNKGYATLEDTLLYTIAVNNTGTVTLSNVNFIDLIEPGATFVSNSVQIDGIPQTGYDPNVGFLLADIVAGGSRTVSFAVSVTSMPIPPQINNTAHITYSYQINPSGTIYTGSQTSNTVNTIINQMTVTHTKAVDEGYATVGDTLTYTSVIVNTGTVNIVSTNFTDPVPIGTTFVPGSVSINGVPYTSYDPTLGFTLGTLIPNQQVTVVFKVQVTSLPISGRCNNTANVRYQYQIDPSQASILANATSNTVTTYIRVGALTLIKVADRQEAGLTDVVHYNFVLTNSGNTPLTTLVFQDSLQTDSSFNIGTVTINGIPYTSYDPTTGFNVSDMQPAEVVTIEFDVTVNTLPQPDSNLYNSATTTYTYLIDPTGQWISGSQTSNTTIVRIKDMILLNAKTVDQSIAKVGETLTFTVTLNNQGDVDAQNIRFTDTLDSHLSFNLGSVMINTTPYPGYNPNTGFAVPDILNGEVTTVTFTADIIAIPPNNIVYNTANIAYEYTISGIVYPVATTTNTTQTFIAVGALTVVKAVNKAYATVPDTLFYSILVTNTGSVNATNLLFNDLIDPVTSFQSGTVIVNGISQPTYDPIAGFSLADLAPYQSHHISFEVNVNSVPASGVAQNIADVTFSYQLTPMDPVETVTIPSNTVTTTINLGVLDVTKVVDKAYATLQDQLTYSFTVTNAGNASCSNVFFLDTLQSDALFNTGTVIVNNVNQPSYNPNTGFMLADLPVGQTTTIRFTVTVNTLPGNAVIYDQATVNFSYTVNPMNPPNHTSSTSNTVATTINVGSLGVNKTASKAYATIGETILYTVNIINQGNVNATTVNFRDVIPTGLTFVPNTVTINGVNQPGNDPTTSFTLGTLLPGATSIVTFSTTVTSVPTPSLVTNIANLLFSYRINPVGPDLIAQVDSNPVATQINIGQVNVTKSVDQAYVTIGDQLTYSFVVTNVGNVGATGVMFADHLQSEVSFNSGSVIVNSLPQPTFDPTIGFSLGDIATLSQVTVSFNVTVKQGPTRNTILNQATIGYGYQIDPSGNTYVATALSNTVSTALINPQMSATKVVDLAYATLLDDLNYTILVSNTGSATIRSVFFTDFLSSGATFIVGSVIVNGMSQSNYDPTVGFNLPDILAGDNVNIQFRAQVTAVPMPPQVTNYALAIGTYTVDPAGPDYQISATTNTVSTQINVGNILPVKTVDKLYANVGDILTYTTVLTNTGNIVATDVWFFDTLQAEVSFIPGTVRVGGVVNPSLDPIVGFNLGALAPMQSITIDLAVNISTLPAHSRINNRSQVEFSYQINPSGATITQTNFSNTVTSQIVLGQLTATKSVDKGLATIGDQLAYTIQIVNTGNEIVNAAFFQDTPSTGATFNSGSVSVNGIAQPSYDPTVGFSLGDIGIGSSVSVVFVTTVTSVPVSNQVTNQAVINFTYLVDPKQPPVSRTAYTNTVITNIALGNLSVVKAVDKAFATIGEYLTYTVVVTNIGNINATNVIFIDPTPDNAIFALGSVYVNGVPQPTYNPAVGFQLNTMTPGQIITVVYQVQVMS